MHEATRLLVAYMPYKFHLHRIQQDLAQPWLIGYRRHPFTTRAWAYLDIDNGAHERPQALDDARSNSSHFVVADHRTRDGLGGVVHRPRTFALDCNRDRFAAPVRDPRAAARHRVHHRRIDRSAADRATQCDRCAAAVAGRVMAVVHRVQYRSTMAREFSRATHRQRCCASGGVARSRLHVQPGFLAALGSGRIATRLERRDDQSRTCVCAR